MATKKSTAGSQSADAGGKTPPPFGSIEGFVFEVLTLRSNASYRDDVAMLMQCESDVPDRDWAERFCVADRPFQAARNLIGTWDLICRTLMSHYADAKSKALFFETVPVANVYAWLRPAIMRLAEESKLDADYARHFREIGEEALKRLPAAFRDEVDQVLKHRDVDRLSPREQREFYRTVDRVTRPLTHFG